MGSAQRLIRSLNACMEKELLTFPAQTDAMKALPARRTKFWGRGTGLLAALCFLGACSASSSVPDVKSFVTPTVFPEPVSADQCTVWTAASDLSAAGETAVLMEALKAELRRHGCIPVDDPDIARFLLRIGQVSEGKAPRRHPLSADEISMLRGSVPGGLATTWTGGIPAGLLPDAGTGLFSQIGDALTPPVFAVLARVRMARRMPVTAMAGQTVPPASPWQERDILAGATVSGQEMTAQKAHPLLADALMRTLGGLFR